MSEREDDLLIKDILDCIQKVEEYTLGFTLSQFQSDIKTQDAVSRNFTIIGEAASRLTADFKTSYSSINWREIKDFKNKLIHDYFGVDVETVWNIIQNDLPLLKQQLQSIEFPATGD
jgi:uncharacterized protein with HEPN domain